MELKNFWVKPLKKRIESSTHYAEIKTKKQSKTGEQYIDLIIGKKGKDRKKGGMHLGWKLGQSLHFIKPRMITHKIKRQVTSKLYGDLGKEEMIYNELKDVGKNIRIQFEIDGSTGEVKLSKFSF